jgi:hypothetical protein
MDAGAQLHEGEMCNLAAEGGYLEVKKWARYRDCPQDEITCTLRS